jgi:hypothetical protein
MLRMNTSKSDRLTKKLSKGAVLRKRKTPSVARLLRTVRTAATGRQSFMNCNWGHAYANGFVVLTEELHIFRLGPVAAGGKMNRQA